MSEETPTEELFEEDIYFSKEEILNTFDGESIAGENIRDASNKYHDKYLTLRDLRNTLRKEENNVIESSESSLMKPSNKWQQVITDANDLLCNAAKDIEILSWFIEAVSRVHNIPGIIFGFDLLREFVKVYSQDFHPKPPEVDDDEDRLLPIVVLNGQRDVGSLVIMVYAMPLFVCHDESSYNAWDVKNLFEQDKLPGLDASQNNISKCKAFRAVIPTFNKNKLSDNCVLIERLMHSFQEMNKVLSDTFSIHAPNIDNLQKVISYVRNLLINTKKNIEGPDDTTVSDDEGDKTSNTKMQGVASFHDNTASRQNALESLEKLSDFFEKNDPHSPATYLLKRAVKWFNSSLEDLMQDILDDDDRDKYCRITGVPFAVSKPGASNEDECYED